MESKEINWQRIVWLMHKSIAGAGLDYREQKECSDAYSIDPERYSREHDKARDEEHELMRSGGLHE